MATRNSIALSVIVLCVNAPASAVFVRHDRDLARTLEMARPFEMTARISADGTGTLIDPRWILTAAHVARGISPFAPYVQVNGERYGIERIVMHPESRSPRPQHPPRVDLALIRLDRPVDGVRPAGLYRGDDERGRDVVIAGYGDFGPAGKQPQRMDGRRRAVTNVIDDVGPARVRVTFDAPPGGTDLEGMGGPGDSGGPLLIVKDGVALVAGVSSASMGGPPGTYGAVDVYARVSTAAAWIDGTIADPPASDFEIATPRDLARDGWPDTAEATVIRAFVDAIRRGEREGLIAFSREHRLAGARRERPDEAWATAVLDRRREMGTIEAIELVRGDRGDHQVLVRAEDGSGTWIVGVLIQDHGGPRLDGWGIRRGPG